MGAASRIEARASSGEDPRHCSEIAERVYQPEDQIAGRDGGIGVRREALENAFENPTRDVERLVDGQDRVSYRYIGEDASVVVNEQGKVITGWANGSRGTPGGSGG